jgi:hypothetical protein
MNAKNPCKNCPPPDPFRVLIKKKLHPRSRISSGKIFREEIIRSLKSSN